jgi:hypothetical protein
LAVASTNRRKTQAPSEASGGAYVLRCLTPSETAKVQITITTIPRLIENPCAPSCQTARTAFYRYHDPSGLPGRRITTRPD